MRKLLALALAVAVAGTGCSKKAVVYTQDGFAHEGEISGGDASSIHVGGKRIQRNEVVDINHPGNGRGAVGIIFSTIGTIFSLVAIGIMASVINNPSNQDPDDANRALTFSDDAIVGFIGWGMLAPALTSTAISTPFAIEGMVTWSRSKDLAEGRDGSRIAPAESDTQAGRDQKNEGPSAAVKRPSVSGPVLDCDQIFDAQEEAVEFLEALLASSAAVPAQKVSRLISDIAEREARYARMCFGYYEQGQSLKARRLRLEKQIGTSAPSGDEAPPEDAPADDQPPAEGERPPAGDSFTIRFLGIAPISDENRDLKGMVVGFEF